MLDVSRLKGTREEATAWNRPLGVPGFRFADLNRVRRLEDLDQAFLAEVRRNDAALADRLLDYRARGGEGIAPLELSTTLVEVGRHLGRFVARLFRIEEEAARLDRRAIDDQVIFDCRRNFLERRVLKTRPDAAALAALDLAAVERSFRDVVARMSGASRLQRPAGDPELELAATAMVLVAEEAAAKKSADAAAQAAVLREIESVGAWAAALAFHPALRERTREWALFHAPEKLDYDNLVERHFDDPGLPTLFRGPAASRRFRDGFELTDRRQTPRQALGEMHYCVLCHERGKDSCSHGFPAAGEPPATKAPEAATGATPAFRRNPIGIPLTGCPLDEKISEIHALKRQGHSIAALAMIVVDNPMCAGTGHRICNDCMKACIYQKQTPVNIPQAETNVLTDVLRLPYGFEIYALLTRWNPLNVKRPFPLPYNGKNVLVVGMGPAGYTLAQYLLNEGFGVVGIEGLKVEPLPLWLKGTKRRPPRPIRDLSEITGPLDQRVISGFGGVSEYGITVRWDKNFLDIIHILLARRKKFRLYDGIRFGGTLTVEDCWRLGFHHIALATGAGRPTLLSVRNNLLRGVRAASDFLMGLQGTGVYRKRSLGNLQVELPALVVGGGLTAIDTATEMQAYYAEQTQKTVERYETLCARSGEAEVRRRFDLTELATLDRWLEHGRALRAEREAAAREERKPDFNRLIEKWGGIRIVYRKRLIDSPAYRLNHEEVIKCLEEGITIAECLNPVELAAGPDGALASVRLEEQALVDGQWTSTGRTVEMPARTLMVAAGTHPNAMYEREHPRTFSMDRWGEFYLGYRLLEEGGARRLVQVQNKGEVGFFTSYEKDGHYITFYGDNHPAYAGNVVKAMASARFGYPEIVRLFQRDTGNLDPAEQPDREVDWVHFVEALDDQLVARAVDVIRLTPNIVEVIVRAPQAARNFHPGQFYRLQNYESLAERVAGFPLQMEGIAATGAWVDREQGLLSMILLEMGGSSSLCHLLQPGERVVVMGPTGTPTEIPRGETVLLAGGGLGNAVLFSIAQALRENGNRIIYFAGYKKAADLYKRSEIEKSCDIVVWSTDVEPGIAARRPQDRSFVGNIVQAMEAYATGKLGAVPIPISEVDRLITIGSDRMMAAVKTARRTVLACHLPKDHVAIGSINSPMQCMMKEICAQCLQKHVDPVTGREEIIFSCFNQDQPLDSVDFQFLNERLRQNTTQEKLTALWIERLLTERQAEAGLPEE